MSTWTVKELDEAIDKQYNSGYEFYDELSWKDREVEGFGTAHLIESTGGSEGDGEYMDVIFKIDDRIFRKTGMYDSWDSSEWDGDLEEVEPREVTITQYFSIGE